MRSLSPLDQFERLQEASRRRGLHDLELAQIMDGADWETWDGAEKSLVPTHEQWAEMRDSMLSGLSAAAELMKYDARTLKSEFEIELLAIEPEKRPEKSGSILGGDAIWQTFYQFEEWIHFLVAASWRLKAARAWAMSHVANAQQFDPKRAVEL